MEIVFTESNLLRDEPFTTSLIISKYAEVTHKAIRQLINKYVTKLKGMGKVHLKCSL